MIRLTLGKSYQHSIPVERTQVVWFEYTGPSGRPLPDSIYFPDVQKE